MDRVTVENAVSGHLANMDCTRVQKATKTNVAVFDRLSKNVLQNVMSFFDYKGADFMKMRSINHKAKNSYMQEL